MGLLKYFSQTTVANLNNDFMDMCENLGITVKATAAESPSSNGLVERHKLISEMLDEIIDGVNAKNSLHNLHGFSPYQLTLGTNLKLPSTLSDKLPALTNKPVSKVISQNFEALHKKHSLQLRFQKE